MNAAGQKPLYPNMNFGAQPCCFICLTHVIPSAGEMSVTKPSTPNCLNLSTIEEKSFWPGTKCSYAATVQPAALSPATVPSPKPMPSGSFSVRTANVVTGPESRFLLAFTAAKPALPAISNTSLDHLRCMPPICPGSSIQEVAIW